MSVFIRSIKFQIHLIPHEKTGAYHSRDPIQLSQLKIKTEKSHDLMS